MSVIPNEFIVEFKTVFSEAAARRFCLRYGITFIDYFPKGKKALVGCSPAKSLVIGGDDAVAGVTPHRALKNPKRPRP